MIFKTHVVHYDHGFVFIREMAPAHGVGCDSSISWHDGVILACTIPGPQS